MADRPTMEAKERERYVDAIVHAFTKLRTVYVDEAQPPKPLVFPHPEWKIDHVGSWSVVYQRRATEKALEHLAEAILRKTSLHDRYFPYDIDKSIREILGACRFHELSESGTRSLVEGRIKELDAATRDWTAYFIVDGLSFPQPLTIGPFTLFTVDAATLEKLAAAGSAPTAYDEMLDPNERFRNETIAKMQLGTAALKVGVHGADTFYLQHRAQTLADDALDFLQIAVESAHPYEHTVVRAGELRATGPSYILVSNDGANASYGQIVSTVHPLTADDLLKLDELGHLATIIAKDDRTRTPFEQLLLTSMHWIADASRQQGLENYVTSTVTGIELFFSSKDAPIVRDVCEGVALVLGGTVEARVATRDLMQHFYGLRSGVSHRGRRDLWGSDVFDLRPLAFAVLRAMCRLSRRFTTREQLRAWIERQRLSDAPEPFDASATKGEPPPS